MTYSEQQWHIREATLGDIAEGSFERHCETADYPFERYGLNRPLVDMRLVPAFVRYSPDYLVEIDGECLLMEVQGCGRDQTFKFKDDKIDALLDWDYTAGRVHVWLWDEIGQRHWTLPIHRLCDLLDKHGVQGSFPEGKPYWSLKTEHLDE